MAFVQEQLTNDKKKVELLCEVSAEDFANAVERAYKREVKKIQLPGFRKGKAPRHMIEKMYGEGFFYEDAANDLLPDEFEKALDACEHEVIGRPEVKVDTLSKEEGMKVIFTMELRPEITIKKYKGISAEKEEVSVTSEDVDHELWHLQKRNARMITVEDRPAQMGDTVSVDFEGFVDGKAFAGGKGTQPQLVLGSHSFIDTFEDQIAGHNVGDEFDVNVTFPEEYHEASLSGKPAVFKCKLNEIRFEELPELDDEFAKDVSEFDTLKELKEDIKKHLTDEAERRSNVDFENALMDQIIETIDEEIPEAMIQDMVDEDVRQFSYNLSYQGLDLNTYFKYTGLTEAALRAQMRPSSEKKAKVRLALESVARQEKMSISDEEVENQYKELADQYKMDLDKVKEVVSAKTIKADLLTNKALDFVREKGKAVKKKATKTHHHDHDHDHDHHDHDHDHDHEE